MQHKATIFYEWEQGKSAYSFPFPYLSKQFVKVRVDHANASTLLEYNRDYTIEGQTLTLTPVQPFVSGATLCIYRQTPTGSLVDFSDGSLLLASEMDRLSTHLLHVEEENSDLIASTGMFADDDNSWQGQGRRIKNLSDPVDVHDAVTLSHLDKVGVARREEIEAVAARAENAASTAEQHRDKANEARNSAEAAKTAAEKFAKDAQGSAASARTDRNYTQDQMHQVETAVSNMKSNLTSMNSAVSLANGYAERCTYERERSESISTAMLKIRAEVESARNEAAASAKQAVAIAGFNGVVHTDMLEDGSVTSPKIADGTISISKLAPDTQSFINSPKPITDGAVTLSKLNQEVLTKIEQGTGNKPTAFVSIVNAENGRSFVNERGQRLFKWTMCKPVAIKDYDGVLITVLPSPNENTIIPCIMPLWLLYHLPLWRNNSVRPSLVFCISALATLSIRIEDNENPEQMYIREVSSNSANQACQILDVELYKIGE